MPVDPARQPRIRSPIRQQSPLRRCDCRIAEARSDRRWRSETPRADLATQWTLASSSWLPSCLIPTSQLPSTLLISASARAAQAVAGSGQRFALRPANQRTNDAESARSSFKTGSERGSVPFFSHTLRAVPACCECAASQGYALTSYMRAEIGEILGRNSRFASNRPARLPLVEEACPQCGVVQHCTGVTGRCGACSASAGNNRLGTRRGLGPMFPTPAAERRQCVPQ